MMDLELWAGVECTINRVNDTYFDQLKTNGHDGRLDDLDRIAALGIRTLRYPCLWERAAPHTPYTFHWQWMDERLDRLRALGIHPIAGLLHHGSGPAYTHLTDPDFPEKFACYAAAFAARYPWVRDYTPINEPLTTARFSGLYGHWYPHAQAPDMFLTALVNQCRATVLAMQAIRRVNPQARLIQTEDMGRYWSTPTLHDRANFLNARRWLSFDLLCGGIDERHPLYGYLLRHGITAEQLAFFLENPCPPNVLGINYYATSERLIDEAYTEYPPHMRGDHERHGYVDIEAVRTHVPIGLGPVLQEVWARYGLPIAVTEVHLNCTREEQMRWLHEAWHTALDLRAQGVDLRAITAWSVFGAFHWDKLLTCEGGCYESGLFDVRAPQPRPTALADLVRALATGQPYQHPALAAPGWWRRPERIFYPRPDLRDLAVSEPYALPAPVRAARRGQPRRPLLITGATGTLGRAFARLCDLRALDYRLLTRQELDITDPTSVAQVMDDMQPWAVINTAGYVRVDEAEGDAGRCFRENADGPALLAAACAQQHCRLLTFSSDLVFDGQSRTPYLESAPVNPLNVYGAGKAEAERRVLAMLPEALVVRTSAFFGLWDEYNFAAAVLRALRHGEAFHAADDAVVSPTYVPDLVNVSLDLLIDGERGIWHLANQGAVTWAEFARQVAEAAGLEADLVIGMPSADFGFAAQRPLYTALSSERGWVMPTLEHAVERWAEALTNHNVWV